jgi:hypothetical protein
MLVAKICTSNLVSNVDDRGRGENVHLHDTAVPFFAPSTVTARSSPGIKSSPLSLSLTSSLKLKTRPLTGREAETVRRAGEEERSRETRSLTAAGEGKERYLNLLGKGMSGLFAR